VGGEMGEIEEGKDWEREASGGGGGGRRVMCGC
jgi:hypothetical protein